MPIWRGTKHITFYIFKTDRQLKKKLDDSFDFNNKLVLCSQTEVYMWLCQVYWYAVISQCQKLKIYNAKGKMEYRKCKYFWLFSGG